MIFSSIVIQTFAKSWSGVAKIMEPNKCTEIGWFNINNLPKPLFMTVENLIKTGQIEKLQNA